MNQKERTLADILDTRYKSIPQNYIFAFWESMICFFIVHFYAFSDKFYNNDDAIFSKGGAGLSSGRWFKHIANSMSTDWSIPWMTGLLAAIYMSIAICFIVRIYEVKSRFAIILISLGMISFPTIADQARYLYTIDGYILALLLVCGGVFITLRYTYGFFVGGLLFALSLGIYQAYFCFAIPIFMLVILINLLNMDISLKKTAITIFQCLASMLGGLIYYKVILEVLLRITGETLSDYMDINSMFNFSVFDIFDRVKNAYFYFYDFYSQMEFNFYEKNMVPVWGSLFILLLFVVIFLVVKKKLYHYYVRSLLICLLIVFFPLGINIIRVMSVNVHGLMVYGFCFPLIMGGIVIDRFRINYENNLTRWFSIALSCGIMVTCIILNINNIQETNVAYFKLDVSREANYAFLVKLSERIEMVDDYDSGKQVLLVGQIDRNVFPIIQDEDVAQHLNSTYLLRSFPGVERLYTKRSLLGYSAYYLGKHYIEPPKEKANYLQQDTRVQEMPTYPDKDSIQIIDDVIVVKFSEPEE